MPRLKQQSKVRHSLIKSLSCQVNNMNKKPSQEISFSGSYIEQEEIINRKFKEYLHSKDSISQQTVPELKFNPDELETISKRFNQLCNKEGTMSYQQFRKGLGLLGREDTFISRIFNLIDEDADGKITEQNYLKYLSIILKGNDLQKARFGWLILTENKGDMDLKDFMELFQQISVVWNTLTGEVVTPKRKYVEELFNTFDVDQDQTITFHDYRLFFNQHLQLSGWFEYFNGIDYDEAISRGQLEKVRKRLRTKLKIEDNQDNLESPEELKMLVHDFQFRIEKKLLQLTQDMRQTAQEIREKQNLLKKMQLKKDDIQDLDQSIYNTSHSTTKTLRTTNDEGSSLSIKSFYKYNHELSVRSTSLNKLQLRKRQLNKQTKATINQEVARQLNGFLEKTYKLMNLCQSYRGMKQRQRRYSPTKVRQMQVRLNLVNKRIQHEQSKDTKKKMTVYFGHQNWNLVLNIMVGLRKSIRSLTTVAQIKESHFTDQHEFYLGNKAFLSGRGPEALKNIESFQFIQIAPAVFEHLRIHYGVSNTEYQRSVGPQSLLNQLLTGDLTALNEKCSTGKSGAFFYLTSDNKIFLKTLPKHEFIFFTKIIENYYKHMTEYSNTLIVRIFGLYKLKIYQNKQKINTIYFISMENIFWKVKAEETCKIVQVYDLKGSLYGRMGAEGGELKDQDWIQKNRKIELPQQFKEIFRDQITMDSRFFKKNNINDYSLMVAIVKYSGDLTTDEESNLFKRVKGGVFSRQKGLLYVLSIIDILTVFETRKNLEYIFKSTFLSKDVSCIPPYDYCHRFRDFIHNSIN